MHELIEQYETTGTVFCEGQEFPIVDILMMSDEKWQSMAKEAV